MRLHTNLILHISLSIMLNKSVFRVTRRSEENRPIFQKVARKVVELWGRYFGFFGLTSKSINHLHQTTFENLKYPQQSMYWNFLFSWNTEKFLKQKVAQNVDNSLGYIIFSKSSPIGVKSHNLVTLSVLNWTQANQLHWKTQLHKIMYRCKLECLS